MASMFAAQRRPAPSCHALRLIALGAIVGLTACPSDDGDGADSLGADASSSLTEDTGDESTQDTSGESTEDTETEDTACEPATTVEFFRLLAGSSAFPEPLTEEGQVALEVPDSSSIGGGERIYLYADHELDGQTFTTQFMTLTVALNDTGCAINLPIDLYDIEPVTLPVVDATGDERAPVELGEVGELGSGVDVYEITELTLSDTDCDGVLGSLSYAVDGGPYPAAWIYTGQGAELRDLRIYVGDITDGCP